MLAFVDMSHEEYQMRLHRLMAVTLTIITLLCIQAVPSTSALQDKEIQTRPLRVRGGGSLGVQTESVTSRRAGKQTKLTIDFEGAQHRAGDGLSQGQGAWLDRGMQQGEPTRLVYYASEATAQKIVDSLRGAGKYYTFDCYDTKRGYLQAVRAYP
jgi:hypothetical protein